MRTLDFLKTKNIIKVSPRDTLSIGLSHLNSSHDAAFVFNEEKKFIGVINPYYCLINSSYPGNAKIEHCLFHPPKLRTNFPISRVARLMIESKIHYLPVFDENDKFTGIVSARNLLKHLRNSPLFNEKIGEFLKTKTQPLLTAFEDDLISQAINLFKTYKVSKLIIINKDMKLKGILTYYDLIQFLITPKQKVHRGDREGTKVSFTYHRIKNFAKNYVLTLTTKDSLKDALELILNKGIGSVVIVDKQKHPIGIITTRDFLNVIAKSRTERKLEVVGKNLSEGSKKILRGFLNSLSSWVKKVPDLTGAKLFVKEEKSGGVFKAVLSLFPKRGKAKVIKSEGKNLVDVLKKVKKD